MTTYAGDELYDDEVTSGPYEYVDSEGHPRGAWGERFEYEGDAFDPCIEGED